MSKQGKINGPYIINRDNYDDDDDDVNFWSKKKIWLTFLCKID